MAKTIATFEQVKKVAEKLGINVELTHNGEVGVLSGDPRCKYQDELSFKHQLYAVNGRPIEPVIERYLKAAFKQSRLGCHTSN